MLVKYSHGLLSIYRAIFISNLADIHPRYFKVMAILLGMVMLGFYLGQTLGMLLILLAALWVLVTPLRYYIPDIIKDLQGKISTKLLILTLLAFIPAIIISIAPVASFTTWGLTILCLLVFVILAVFAHAPLAQKLLTCKIMLLSVLIFHLFIILANYGNPDLLISIWNVRKFIGDDLNKSPHYYYFITPKLLLNGLFIVIPLLWYVAFRYLSHYWKLLTVLNIASIIWLIIIFSNRAVLAGTMSMLVLLTIIFWFSRAKIWLKYGLPLLLLLAVAIYSMFFFIPAGGFDIKEANKKHVNYTVYDKKKTLPSFLPYAVMRPQRQILLYEAMVEWRKAPLFGIGINITNIAEDFQTGYKSYHTARLKKSVTDASNVHNRFVEILLETGLVGFVPFMIFLLVTCGGYIKQTLRKQSMPALALLLTHSGYWTAGLFQLSVWEAWIFMIFGLLVILLYSFAKEDEHAA